MIGLGLRLGRLPVLKGLEGTDDWILRIFVIYLFPTFSRSRYLFLAVSQSYQFGWSRKSRSTSGFGSTLGYCQLGLMDFSNLFIPYVVDVKVSIFRSLTELFCSGDLENLDQLPVLQYLKGTDDWVLRIFVISLFSTFSRSRNLFLAVSQSYQVRVTLKI